MNPTDPELVLAPMRGVTAAPYRQAFIRHFAGLDAAMAPFIPTVAAPRIHPKLLRDVLPETAAGLPLVPQVIGNQAEDFLQMCMELHRLGYAEVNWNLGCPHKPVRRKQRGAGLIPLPERVDAILGRVCPHSPCRISVKVRLGVEDKAELMALVPVLNRHPLAEVVIHPRTAEQMYDGAVDLDAFGEAAGALAHPVCYNGDIGNPAFLHALQRRFPAIRRFMIGRGLLANPFLCEEIKGLAPGGDRIARLAAFHDDLLARYEALLYGDHPVLGKMKEFWRYQSAPLSNGAALFKKVKKAQRLASYKAIVGEALADAAWTP